MEKLVYATDFSENAEKAFLHAVKLARKHVAELILLHVFDIPASWNYSQAKNAAEMEPRAMTGLAEKVKPQGNEHAKGLNMVSTFRLSIYQNVRSGCL